MDNPRGPQYKILSYKSFQARTNTILKLKDENGVWLEEHSVLITHVMAFFKSLFTNEDSVHSTLSTQAGFPPLPDHVLEPLSRTPDAQEVKQAIFSMGSLKAPGVDGFPPLFYHEHWDTVGPSLTRFVQDAFTSPIYLDEANKTLIVLIPKRKREPRESYSIYANFFVQCGL